jgi:GAF domain-containing protein
MNTTLNTTSADPKDRLIADLQRQLAASNAERDEAIARETATAEVLQMINSSPGNLVPVFDAMLERATRLCEADFGTLWTFDGDRFRPAVGRGHGAAGPNTMPEGVRPAPGVPLGRLIAGEDVVHVVDVATDDAFQSDPALRSRTTALGTRSALAVALRKDNALLGAITASRKRVEPYSDKQIALLNNFAGQAVIAMENARLLTETREALEQPAAVHKILMRQKIKCAGRIERLIGSRGAVSRNPAGPEAIDGERNVPPGTQPVGPGHHEIIKAGAVMENDDGRGRACLRSSRPCKIAEQPERAGISRNPVELYKLPGTRLRRSSHQQGS